MAVDLKTPFRDYTRSSTRETCWNYKSEMYERYFVLPVFKSNRNFDFGHFTQTKLFKVMTNKSIMLYISKKFFFLQNHHF